MEEMAKAKEHVAEKGIEFKNYPNNSLREPTLDWRKIPGLEHVVLDHFKSNQA